MELARSQSKQNIPVIAVIFAAVFMSLLIGLVRSDDTYANYGEAQAVSWCNQGFARAGANWFSNQGSGSDRIIIDAVGTGSEWVTVTFYTKLRNCTGGSHSGANLHINASHIGGNVNPQSRTNYLYRASPPTTAGTYGPAAQAPVQFRRSWLVAQANACSGGSSFVNVWVGQFAGGTNGDIRLDRCSIRVDHNWNTAGATSINRTTASPGHTVTWTHTITKTGTTNTNRAIGNTLVNSNGWSGTHTSHTISSGRGNGEIRRVTNSRTITRADIGRTLCQNIRWSPRAHNSTAERSSTRACVTIVPSPWTTTGSSTRTVNGASVGTAAPGDTIRWTHTLRLNTNQNHLAIRSQTNSTGFSNGWNGIANVANAAAWRPVGVIRNIGSSTANRTQYIVTQNDVGNTLCQQLQWDPINSSGGRNGRSTNQCVTIPYNYNLTPILPRPTSTDTISPGSPVTLTPSVTNNGPTKSRDTEWQLTEVVVNPGGPIPNEGGGTNPAAPCGTYFRPGAGAGSCDIIGSGNTVFDNGPNPLSLVNRTISDSPVGTKLCWGLSVRPYSHNSPAGQWRHSPLVCLTVGKSPKVQVHGGNLIAQSVTTSTTIKQGDGFAQPTIFGSWSEYGILAPGTIIGMSSASGLNTGSTHTTVPSINWSRLTYANTQDSATTLGNYTLGHTPQSIIDTLPAPTQTLTGDVNIATLDSATYTIAPGSTINLTADPSYQLPAGRTIIITAPASTINITDNLHYTTDQLTSLDDIPQLVIIAGDINIAESVTNVDAWLIAHNTAGTGTLVTCSYGGALASNLRSVTTPALTETLRLHADRCDQVLTVNGPVIADRLWLRRTAGSGTGPESGDPAEIFNLRPDAYLWVTNFTDATAAYRNAYVRELPPRF